MEDKRVGNAPENPENSSGKALATVCGREGSLWVGDGARGYLYLRPEDYAPEQYRQIRAGADEWMIREKYSEWYDYDVYANLGGDHNKSVRYRPVGDSEILVKDGAFFGAVLSFPETTDLRYYACAADGPGRICFLMEPDPPENREDPVICRIFDLERCREEVLPETDI